MTNKGRILLLIDGNNLFYRAYHALPPLTDKTGENANAVFGFSNMILKAIGEIKPEYVACAFDTKAPTFRHVEFEAYKAQRKPPPEDLYPQLPKVKKVLDAFGIPYFEKAGYEADDLLGTVATRAIRGQLSEVSKKDKKKNTQDVIANEMKQSKKWIAASPHSANMNVAPRNDDVVDQVVILSGDRDVLQLVDGKIKVQMPGWNLATTTLFGSSEVLEKYGITPLQMVDYKAMTGDPSDNVPGIAGIGPKTAAALLQKYKTLEGIYGHIDEISGTTKDKLVKDKEIALAAKKLVKLDTNVEISCQLSELRFDPEWGKVVKEFEGLGFKSIINKLPGASGQRPEEKVIIASKVSKVEKLKDTNQLELI